ncbi:hypothetical protein ES319_D05G372300v1 [Gossypium barbadense]|uniref:Uncharacterized protein n=2 Tax=Gossypium TaxID=3633 RepID=A0A5J5RLW5_GOSBA|nr:hypothetical protein ES319_D05G372300v1 [Gossypium barbadense]TYG71452.1 hypothetical protein ES288_D05G397500v1 [Gossypium darwinii]
MATERTGIRRRGTACRVGDMARTDVRGRARREARVSGATCVHEAEGKRRLKTPETLGFLFVSVLGQEPRSRSQISIQRKLQG